MVAFREIHGQYEGKSCETSDVATFDILYSYVSVTANNLGLLDLMEGVKKCVKNIHS